VTDTHNWSPPERTGAVRIAVLTPRQADVLTGICLGLTNYQIGRRLHISEDTVKTHTRRLYKAMGGTDRVEATALVYSGAVTVRVQDGAE